MDNPETLVTLEAQDIGGRHSKQNKTKQNTEN
jgi:hypothetical protein